MTFIALQTCIGNGDEPTLSQQEHVIALDPRHRRSQRSANFGFQCDELGIPQLVLEGARGFPVCGRVRSAAKNQPQRRNANQQQQPDDQRSGSEERGVNHVEESTWPPTYSRSSDESSLDPLAADFDPTVGVIAAGRSVGPVQHAAAIVPLELSAKADRVSGRHRHPIGQIDIVSDEQSASVREANQESLVTRVFLVVAQGLRDDRVEGHLKARFAAREGLLDPIRPGGFADLELRSRRGRPRGEIESSLSNEPCGEKDGRRHRQSTQGATV